MSNYFFGDDADGMNVIDKYALERQESRPGANAGWLKFTTAFGFSLVIFIESFIIIALIAIEMVIYCTLREWALKTENFGEGNEYLDIEQQA